MTDNTTYFYLSAAFLLTVIPVLGTIVLITLRESDASAFSLVNMLSAGLYFALGITGSHVSSFEDAADFYFTKNVVIAATFSAMIYHNQSCSKKELSSAKYARVGGSEEGIEMGGPNGTRNSPTAFDFALDAPAGIAVHFPIILSVFSFFSFIDALQFSQNGHTGYGSLAEMMLNKAMMSICFGTAAAADSVMSKRFPKFAPVFFLSSPIGILAGVLISSEIPKFMSKYTYFTINGVCLYVATSLLIPEELRARDATALKLGCFAFGFMSVFLTEYFMY